MRREDADAGAVAQFVDLVADIDDVKARGEMVAAGPLEALAEADIDGVVGGQRAAVGHAVDVGAQAAAADHLQIGRRFGLA